MRRQGSEEDPLDTASDWLYFLQQSLNALQVGSFYALLTVAYVLIYSVTRRINLAFGAIAMWGGHLVVLGIFVLNASWPLTISAILILAVVFAVVGTSILGLAIERTVFRPLIVRDSLAMLIATIGLAIVLEELVRIASGSRERWVQPYLDDAFLSIGDAGFVVQITEMRAITLAGSVVLTVVLLWFVSHHRFGKVWRACSQDLGMAALCGVNVRVTLIATFVTASAYAAASGAIIALYYGNVSYYMGLVIGMKTLLAAVVGGLTSIGGAIAGAYLLGALESFWSAYFPGSYRDVAVFGILLLLMILRPGGLFTVVGRADSDSAP